MPTGSASASKPEIHSERGATQPSIDPDREIVVRMPKDVIAELAKLADQLNVDATTALRYAISTTAYLYSERADGASLLLERGKKHYEVEWLTPREFSRQLSKNP